VFKARVEVSSVRAKSSMWSIALLGKKFITSFPQVFFLLPSNSFSYQTVLAFRCLSGLNGGRRLVFYVKLSIQGVYMVCLCGDSLKALL